MVFSCEITFTAARLFVEECRRQGVRFFLTAPGSRNGPFLSALAAADFTGTVLRHHDERALGFAAVGLAAATGGPVCVFTTSGTAGAELMPSVIEASKKKVPLIVVTSDRPWTLQDTGANQTIDQTHLFGRHARWFNEVPVTRDIRFDSILSLAAYSVWRSRCPVPGPVHINWMTPEPSTVVVDPSPSNTTEPPVDAVTAEWFTSRQPFCIYTPTRFTTDKPFLRDVLIGLQQHRAGWIAAGKLPDDRERGALLRLAEWLGWPILPDITSGLRQNRFQNGWVWPSFGLCLAEAETRQRILDHQGIEAVLQVGGRLTAKGWDLACQQAKAPAVTMALPHPLRHDPWHRVRRRVVATPSLLWNAVKGLPSRVPSRTVDKRKRFYARLNRVCAETIEDLFSRDDRLTEARLAWHLARVVKRDMILFLGNSLPVRAADGFIFAARARAVFANRGASGIDGQVASFYGTIKGLNKPGILFIGDLGLWHDATSLSLFRPDDPPVLILAANNNGGGIFHQLPWGETFFAEAMQDIFVCPHEKTFRQLAAAFDFDHRPIHDPREAEAAITSWSKRPRRLLIEAMIDPRTSAHQMQRLHHMNGSRIRNVLT